MFSNGDRAGWLNAVASRIMDGGVSPPSIDHLSISVPPMINTRESDGFCTIAAARGEKTGNALKADDLKEGWRIIISEMVTLLREQGFVGGNDQALTWIQPLDGTWSVLFPDGDRRAVVFGQRERRMARDRAMVGERSDNDDSARVAGIFETERGTLEVDVIGARGSVTRQKFGMHPLALIIPPMTEYERETLRAGIAKDGVKIPVVIYEDTKDKKKVKRILDGRNRAYLASALGKPIPIVEFKGTEDEARRHVINLNIHRRHLNAVQLAVIAEELYGKKADQIVAEAVAKGRLKGNQSPSRFIPLVTKSSPTGTRKQLPKRDEIVADLAKADGIKTTGYAIGGVKQFMDAPETFAKVKGGKFHKTRDAVISALKEKGEPVPNLLPEITPRSVVERLGICIDNLNKILIDCEMTPGQKPEKISERLDVIDDLAKQVRQELRKRKMIP
jgi:hypothetical protein